MYSVPLRLFAFLVISVIAVYLGFFAPTPQQSEYLFRQLGYWNILALIGAFAAAILSPTGRNTLMRLVRNREFRFAALFCMVGAIFLFTREGGGFKVVFDEPILSNTALSLHKDHTGVVRESTLFGYAAYETIDKRPLLFPTLVSLVHDIFGYRVENSFYANFTLTAVFLGLLYSIIFRIADRRAAIYSVLLACFMPLIAQNSSGGGFEILNLCCALACIGFAIAYWERPTAGALSRLVLAMALLSHVRYESILIVAPLCLLIPISWIKNRTIEFPIAAIAAPLFFLPLAWQSNYVRDQPGYWQYKLGNGSSFSFDYLATNLRSAARFFFEPNLSLAGSPWVIIVGIAGALAIAGFSATRREKLYGNRPDRVVAVIAASGLILHFTLIMCFTFGQLDDVIVSRLGLPFVMLLIATGAILLKEFHRRHRLGRYAAVCIIVFSALFAFRQYSRAEYTTRNAMLGRMDWALDFASELPKKQYLFVTAMPRPFELYGFNNIGFDNARNRLENIKAHLESGTYDAVYVVQHGGIVMHDGQPQKIIFDFCDLGAGVDLETINEASFLVRNFTRISRIVSMNIDSSSPPGPKPPSQASEPVEFRNLTPEELAEWKRTLP